MVVAFIPVRGGSKSIPLKNIKTFCSKPLVYWTVSAAASCPEIHKVYVSTDSAQIRSTVEDFGLPNVQVIERSAQTASDTASSESALLEFAQAHSFDDIIFIQATSPLLTQQDLTDGLSLYRTPGTDSVLSVTRQKRFCWQVTADGFAAPLNYDPFHRPRRQNFDGYLVENGAFYITARTRLLESKNRLSGNVKAFEMPEDTYFEIDEPADFAIAEQLLRGRQRKSNTVPEIKMLLTDCDGCLTDAGMYYSAQGDALKKFNTRDGMGFALLKKAGILTGIVTGENTEIVRQRAAKLQLDILEMGVENKSQRVLDLCKQYNISPKNVAYLGDDINDIGALEQVGYPCCVANAMPSVQQHCVYITSAKGGEGALRELAKKVLENRG